MTLTQILALVGELNDVPGSEAARERFRRFLKQDLKDVGQVRDYVQECLQTPGTQQNRSLQDLVNHIGTFLGFEVFFGRYQGVQGQLGFDGHWKSPKDFHLVAEVKTTDAYAIKTATLTGYVDGLIGERKIASWECALGLYVVARPDAELKQLENAILAERRTHQLRVVSVESLLSLAEMMTEYDVTHQDILDILRPSGPRIDPGVELMNRLVAQSKSAPPEEIKRDQAQIESIKDVSQHRQESTGEITYWLTSVRSEDRETAEECIQRLVGDGHFYAFSERAPLRANMKAGDRIAFYATTKGVVAHATFASAPERRARPDGSIEPDYPWICSLKEANLYLEVPIAIDAQVRQRLDAFRGRDPEKAWAWFVQANHEITFHDFEVLTRS